MRNGKCRVTASRAALRAQAVNASAFASELGQPATGYRQRLYVLSIKPWTAINGDSGDWIATVRRMHIAR